MRFIITLGPCLALLGMAAGAAPPTAIARAELTKSTVNKDAVKSLEANTFVQDTSDDLVSEGKVFKAWDLHVCVDTCDNTAINDTGLVHGHVGPQGTTAFENITFSACNYKYRKCNNDCIGKYEDKLKSWPLAGTTWPIQSHTKLPTCVKDCQVDGSVDYELLSGINFGFNDDPKYVVDFVFCNQRIHRCISSCQNEFDDEVKAFKRKYG